MSERGGKRRPAVRDLDDLLADAVDRALVALRAGRPGRGRGTANLSEGRRRSNQKLDLHIIPRGESCVKERRRLVARARAARRQRRPREDQGAAAADARREALPKYRRREERRPDRLRRQHDRRLGRVNRRLRALLEHIRERSWDQSAIGYNQ